MTKRAVELLFLSLLLRPGIAHAQDQKAYATMCCTLPATVSVLDTASGAVVRQFPSALGAATMAPTPDYRSIYVLTQAFDAVPGELWGGPPGSVNSLTVLDVTGGPPTVIALASMPCTIAFSHSGRTAYVVAVDSKLGAHLLAIDTGTKTVTVDQQFARYQFGPGVQMIVSEDDATLFVLTYAGVAIWAIDTSSFQIANQYNCSPTHFYCIGLAASGRSYLLSISTDLNGLALIYVDPVSLKQVRSVPLPLTLISIGSEIALSPDGLTAYIGVFVDQEDAAGQLATFDVRAGLYTGLLSGIGSLNTAVVSPDGRYLVSDTKPTTIGILTLSGNVPRNANTLADIATAFFDSKGNQIYVLNLNSSDAAVIDVTAGETTSYIPVGSNPVAIASEADGKHLFVVSQSSQNLSIIETSTARVIRNLPVPWSGQYLLSAVAASGNLFLSDDENVQLLNLSTGSFSLLSIPQGFCYTTLRGMQASPDRKRLYVTFLETDECPPPMPNAAKSITGGVRIFETVNGKAISDVPVASAEQVVFSADGTLAYVGGFDQNHVHQLTSIDTQTLKVANLFVVPSVQSIYSLAVSSDGKIVYILDLTQSTIDSVATDTGSVIATTPIGSHTTWMTMAPDGTTLYLGNSENPWIDCFDTTSLTVGGRIVLGDPATAIAFGAQ